MFQHYLLKIHQQPNPMQAAAPQFRNAEKATAVSCRAKEATSDLHGIRAHWLP